MEWLVHRLEEAITGPAPGRIFVDPEEGELDLPRWIQEERKIPSVAFTDAKSLYDHVTTRSSVSAGLSDHKSGLTLVLLREGLERLKAEFRWIPSALQLGDGLTKLNAGDYLRSIMGGGLYQVQDEAAAMKERAIAKEQRLLRGAQRKEAAARKTETTTTTARGDDDEDAGEAAEE